MGFDEIVEGAIGETLGVNGIDNDGRIVGFEIVSEGLETTRDESLFLDSIQIGH